MPRLRRLTGNEVIKILQRFGFRVVRIKGSHHRLQRTVDDQEQYLTVAVHGSQPIPLPTLHSIYREASRFIPPDELREYFYTD